MTHLGLFAWYVHSAALLDTVVARGDSLDWRWICFHKYINKFWCYLERSQQRRRRPSSHASLHTCTVYTQQVMMLPNHINTLLTLRARLLPSKADVLVPECVAIGRRVARHTESHKKVITGIHAARNWCSADQSGGNHRAKLRTVVPQISCVKKYLSLGTLWLSSNSEKQPCYS